MFKIVRFPEKVKPFFKPLDDLFHWDHAQYFKTLVLLMVFAWGRRTITSLYRHLDEPNWHHRSRFNNFLNLLRWPAPQALQMKASELITHVGPKPGDTLLLILDDSQKQKRGKHMQAVGWIKDPLSGSRRVASFFITYLCLTSPLRGSTLYGLWQGPYESSRQTHSIISFIAAMIVGRYSLTIKIIFVS